MPSAGVRLRCTTGRVRVRLETGDEGLWRLVAAKTVGQPPARELRGTLTVRGVAVSSVNHDGAAWWAELALDVETKIGRRP